MIEYGDYIKEKNEEVFVELVLSKRLIDILIKISSKGSIVAKEIINSYNKGHKLEISFIDVTDNDDFLSYITSFKASHILDKFRSIGREIEGYDFCWINNRQDQRISRLINRLFKNKFDQKQIEEFVNDYKVAFKADHIFDSFELVQGEDIKKYYYEDYSSKNTTGQLQRSCMRYSQCRKFFNILIDNPTKFKMLILKQDDDFIYGRANIWYLDQPEGAIYMDRIYTTYDWQIKVFIDYAIKNNFIYKSKQIYGGSIIPVIKDGKKEKLVMSVNLKPKSYDYYPYIDTLQFYNPKTGLLTSNIKMFHDKDFITLVTPNGGYFIKGNRGFGIDNLGRIVLEQMLVWSEIDKVHIHRNNAVRLRYKEKTNHCYVTDDHDFINLDGSVYLKSDMEWDDGNKTWKLKKNIEYI